MIDLPIAISLAEHGFGEYGVDVFANMSPVYGNGVVTTTSGIWVNSQTEDSTTVGYTDQVTISTRNRDRLTQYRTLLRIEQYVRRVLSKECCLTAAPYVPDVEFSINRVRTDGNRFSIDAVDSEGLFVRSFAFGVDYRIVRYPAQSNQTSHTNTPTMEGNSND